jgi:hypothetical protein
MRFCNLYKIGSSEPEYTGDYRGREIIRKHTHTPTYMKTPRGLWARYRGEAT